MPEPWVETPPIWTESPNVPADLRITELAAGQRGVVGRQQLIALGLGSSMIDRRVRSGMLRRVGRGVYAVGHAALTREGWWMASVLACGDGARLRRRSAAAAWDLIAPGDWRTELAVPGDRGRKLAGVHVVRTQLAPEDCCDVGGLPVTSVARTLVDLGSVLGPVRLGEAVDRALTLGLYDQRQVDDVLSRSRGRPGAAALRADLASRHPDRELTRSWLERVFLPMIDEARLPRPSVNVWLPEVRHEVDLLWPEHKVVVELDGYEGHGRRRQFELDREQTIELEDHGYAVRRYTRDQIRRRPAWAIDRLGRALGRNAPR